MKVKDLSKRSQDTPYLGKKQSELPNIINPRNELETPSNPSKSITYDSKTGRKSVLDCRSQRQIQRDNEIYMLNKANVMLQKIHEDQKEERLRRELLIKQKGNQAQIKILQREVAKNKAREEMMKIKLEKQQQQDMIQGIFEPNKPIVVPKLAVKKAKFRMGQPGEQKRKVPLFKKIEINFQQSLLKDEAQRQIQLKQLQNKKQVANIRYNKLVNSEYNEIKELSADKYKKYLHGFDEIQSVPVSILRIKDSPQLLKSHTSSLAKLSDRMQKKSCYSKIIDDLYERGSINSEKKQQIHSRLQNEIAQSQAYVKDQKQEKKPQIDKRQVLPSVQSVQYLGEPMLQPKKPPQLQESFQRNKISFENLKLPQFLPYYYDIYDESSLNVRQQMIMLDSLIL